MLKLSDWDGHVLRGTQLNVWQERDRVHVACTRLDDDSEMFSAFDDDATQLFEDGFLTVKNLHEDVLDYVATH